MFIHFDNIIECKICGATIEFDPKTTESDYNIIMSTTVFNLSDSVEQILFRHLVYRCSACDTVVKYTFKELEQEVRKAITKQLLQKVLQDQFTNAKALQDKYLIYCGKCSGFDAKGSCPPTIYNKCEIKRFPIDEL